MWKEIRNMSMTGDKVIERIWELNDAKELVSHAIREGVLSPEDTKEWTEEDLRAYYQASLSKENMEDIPF